MAGSVASQNEARTRNELTTPIISEALKEAINTLSTELLRGEVKRLCFEFPIIRRTLEDRLLVRGKDVLRYHDNSEDDTSSELESENESEDSEGKLVGVKRKPIAIGDEEFTARMARCENCEEEFDVTSNYQGDCVWHPGTVLPSLNFWTELAPNTSAEEKTVDYDSEFWADHDEDCHGRYESFEDDPDFANGFTWECCEKPGDAEGCRTTKHRARVNVIVSSPPPVPTLSKKRGAEEENLGTNAKRGRLE